MHFSLTCAIIKTVKKGGQQTANHHREKSKKSLDKLFGLWYNKGVPKEEQKVRYNIMRVVIFDTETTSIEKPFVYNIGYAIYDTDSQEILIKEEYIVEQIWHNRELFTTAYYAEKREWYIQQMRARNIQMEKLGYITQRMARLFKLYEVVAGFAYNSPFDDRVFTFNTEWFKIINPFDNVPIYDIRGYVHKFIAFKPEYKAFCDKNGYYTEKGNYSTTAETVYRYITGNTAFDEDHTALSDALIELDILLYCVGKGAEWNCAYKVYQSIPREIDKTLLVRDVNGNDHNFAYNKITIYSEKKDKTKIILKKTIDK